MAKKEKLIINGKELEISPKKSTASDSQTPRPKAASTPGNGLIEISSPLLSVESVSAGKAVTCKTTIKGKNIAQVFSSVMLKLDHDLYGPISCDFLQSPSDREVRGVKHPRWGAVNEIKFDFQPRIRLITCGDKFSLACMTPEFYGVEPEEQIWSLEGIYQRGGGEPFRVKLEFTQKGILSRKTGFYPASAEGIVSPFELIFEDGDTFEPYATTYLQDETESLVTFNPIMLCEGTLPHWEWSDAPAGSYQIGVVVEDFDGRQFKKLSPVTIQ